MMIPRFCNPHILEDTTIIVSRAQLHDSNLDHNAEPADKPVDIPLLTKRLRELVTDELGDTALALEMDMHSRKRRRVDDNVEDGEGKDTSIRML